MAAGAVPAGSYPRVLPRLFSPGALAGATGIVWATDEGCAAGVAAVLQASARSRRAGPGVWVVLGRTSSGFVGRLVGASGSVGLVRGSMREE